MSKNNVRNLVAAEMGNKFKSKRFGGRGERRADSNRNHFDWRAELAELTDGCTDELRDS